MELPLRDIHLPDEISIWPLALGWWVVIALAFASILICFLIVRQILKPTLKKQAKTTLAEIEKKFLETEDATICITEISAFLRRVTLSQKLEPSQSKAGLKGVLWLKLLDQPLKKPEFSEGCGQILLTGPYSKKVEPSDVGNLIHLCHKWVEAL